jgi:hypothetical protein
MYTGLLKCSFSVSKFQCSVSYDGPNIEHLMLLLNLLRTLAAYIVAKPVKSAYKYRWFGENHILILIFQLND